MDFIQCVPCIPEQFYSPSVLVFLMIAGLDKALKSHSTKPAEVMKLMEIIGRESCFNCHLVQVPAAYAQHGENQ